MQDQQSPEVTTLDPQQVGRDLFSARQRPGAAVDYVNGLLRDYTMGIRPTFRLFNNGYPTQSSRVTYEEAFRIIRNTELQSETGMKNVDLAQALPEIDKVSASDQIDRLIADKEAELKKPEYQGPEYKEVRNHIQVNLDILHGIRAGLNWRGWEAEIEEKRRR